MAEIIIVIAMFFGGFYIGTKKQNKKQNEIIERLDIKLDSLKNVPAKIDTVIKYQEKVITKVDTIIITTEKILVGVEALEKLNKKIYLNTDTIKNEFRNNLKRDK